MRAVWFWTYDLKLDRYMQSDRMQQAASPNEVEMLGLEAGWNTYAYVGNSPVEAMDPWGLKEDTIWGTAKKLAVSIYEYTNSLLVNGLSKTIMMSNAAIDATSTTEDFINSYDLNDKIDGSADAFRHCYLSCSSALFAGQDASGFVLSNHEAINALQGQRRYSLKMDMHNNNYGQQCRSNISSNPNSGNCQQQCLLGVKNKNLIYVD